MKPEHRIWELDEWETPPLQRKRLIIIFRKYGGVQNGFRSAVSLLAGEIGALRFKAPPGFMTRKPVIKP